MPYKFLPDVAIADIAFEVTAGSLEELFRDAAMAMEEETTNVEKLGDSVKKEVRLESDEVDTLLYDFLQELIFLKDAEQFLFKSVDVKISEAKGRYKLAASLHGDTIDAQRHELRNDIKAVTMHMFEVKKTESGWKATVVVDV